VHKIPSDYVSNEARSAFKGENPKVKISPWLIKWFNDWTGSVSSLLLGPSGCGKTLAAALAAETTYQWIMRQPGKKSEFSVARTRPNGFFLRDVQAVRWVRADRLSRILSDRETASEFNQLVAAPLLVIDELGYERFPETVLELIGTRSELGRPMVVTSGRKYSELAERYSDATVRRLADHRGALLVDCYKPAPSVRIAPSWPVVAPVTRHTATGSPDGPSAPERAPVANPEAAKRIRDFARGF